ncbi:hypothetical protein M9458_049066, partial [Cirrhinus mrigala]
SPELSACPVWTMEVVLLSATFPVLRVVIWCMCGHNLLIILNSCPASLFPPLLLCSLSSSAPLPLHPASPSAHPQPTISGVVSLQVWLEDPLSPSSSSESWTPLRSVNPAAPPWLLAPSSPVWPISPPVPQGSLVPPALLWLVVDLLSPQDYTPPAPPAFQLHLGPLSLRLHCGLPDPHLHLGCLSHLLLILCITLALRISVSASAPPLSDGPLESSALPPPWLLPPSASS